MRVQHTDLKKLEWPIFTGSIQIFFFFFFANKVETGH